MGLQSHCWQGSRHRLHSGRVQGTVRGKCAACGAIRIGEGDSWEPALKRSRFTSSSPRLIVSLLLLQLLRVGQH